MLAKSTMHIHCNIAHGIRLRGSVQGHGRRGVALFHQTKTTSPTAVVVTRSTRSPIILAASSPAVPIKIQVEYRAEFGQVLKVVGAGEILGDWDPKQAPLMEWQDGDIWSTTLPLTPGQHEFKLVVSAADSSSSIWEGGNNRSVSVPSIATTGGSSYIAECHWGNPETSMKPSGPEGIATYDAGDSSDDSNTSQTVGKMTIGKMTVENSPAGIADDDEEKEIGKMTIGKMTVDSGVNTTSPTTTTTTTVGKMTMEGGVSVKNDLIDTGIGAEEGFSAAEAMTPEVAMAMASGDEDQLESPFAKAITGILQNLGLGSRDDDDDDNNAGSGGSGVNSKSSENKPSGGGSSSRGSGSPSAGSSFNFSATAAAAAAALMVTTSTPSGVFAATTPFVAPTNPRSPFKNLSSLDLPPPFASPAQAAQGEEQQKEGLLLASTISTDNDAPTTLDPSTSSSSTAADPTTTENDPDAELVGDADDASTLEEFRERLRWLNKITADAQQELDAIAPPPLKSALDSAVKAAKETDVGPALDVTKRVLGDLQEGFSGLFSAAKDFDAATASAQLKERMEKELAARKEIEDAVAAAEAEAAAKEAAASAEAAGEVTGAAGVPNGAPSPAI